MKTGWPTRLPYYYLGKDGQLETGGMISDRPFRDPFFRLLANSSLLEALRIDFPRHGESDFALFAAIIKDLAQTLKEKLNGMELTTVFFPGQNASELIPFFKQANLAYLDYSNLDAARFITGPLTVSDRFHPSAQMNRFVADRILTDLKIRE
jgi:lysophospholipase L1-like esterase